MPRSGSETSHPHNSFNRTHRGWPVVLGAIVVLFAAVGCDEAPGAGPAGTAGSADQPAGQGAPGAPAGGQPDAPSGPAPGQAGTVSALFELLGSGVGDSVLVDDGQRVRSFHDVPLPFRKEIPISTDADLLQVITSGSHATGSGCRITVEGKVVVEHLDSSGCSVNLKSQN